MSPLDELGMAITNAGYTWTPEMRKAYEKGVREQEKKREWVEISDEEGAELWGDAHDVNGRRLITPKEIVQRISDKLKEKNT
jgi:hypothetical protein